MNAYMHFPLLGLSGNVSPLRKNCAALPFALSSYPFTSGFSAVVVEALDQPLRDVTSQYSAHPLYIHARFYKLDDVLKGSPLIATNVIAQYRNYASRPMCSR